MKTTSSKLFGMTFVLTFSIASNACKTLNSSKIDSYDKKPTISSKISKEEAVAFFRSYDTSLQNTPSLDDYVFQTVNDYAQICQGSEDEVEYCDLITRNENGTLESFFVNKAKELAAKSPLIVFGNFSQGDGEDFFRPLVLLTQEPSFGIRTDDIKVIATVLRTLFGYSNRSIPSITLVADNLAAGNLTTWNFGYLINHSQRISHDSSPKVFKVKKIRMHLEGLGLYSPEVFDGDTISFMKSPRDFSTLPGGNADKSFTLKPWNPKVESIMISKHNRWQVIATITSENLFDVPEGPIRPQYIYSWSK